VWGEIEHSQKSILCECVYDDEVTFEDFCGGRVLRRRRSCNEIENSQKSIL